MTDIAVSRPSTPSPLTDCASLVEIAACAGGEVGLELARGVRRLVGLGPDEPVVDPSTAGGLVAEWRLAPSLGDLCFGDRPLEEVPAEDLARTFAVDPEEARRWLLAERDVLARVHDLIEAVLAGTPPR